MRFNQADPDLAEEADDLDRLLALQHRVVSLRQVGRHLSRGRVRSKVDSGRWQLVHRGVVCTHNGPLTDVQRLWVASLAAGAGEPAPLGGRTALGVLGLRGFEHDRIDVLLPAGRRAWNTPSGVAVHRASTMPPEDVVTRGRPPSTTAARSMVDAASWAGSDREAMTVVAMAFQQRLVRLDEVRVVLERLPRAKRRRLAWDAAVDAAGGAGSLAELDLVRLLRANYLPAPTLQKVKVDATGRRRYLDLYFEPWRVHVEVDGAHHLDAGQAWLDMDRQNQVWLNGERILRFPAWLVRQHPRKVVDDIRRALTAAGWATGQDLGTAWWL